MPGGERYPKRIDIVVTSGTGSAQAELTGKIVGIGIKAPANSTYDLEIVDNDGFGICGDTAINGNAFLVSTARSWGIASINITNATNGEYGVKVFFDSE